MDHAAYYDHAVGDDPEGRLRRRQLENPKEMARLRAVVEAIPTEARRVLDVGCGAGIALSLLAAQRPEVEAVGLELSARAAETGRRLFGVRIVQGSAAALPFADDAFDIVLATELLEHLPHGVYDAARTELARVAPRAIITVPFRERRARVICPACGCGFNPFYHLRSFDDAALAGLLPGMRRVSLDITWTRGFFPGLLAARRVKAALGHPPPLPRDTLCPQCGYRRAPKGAPGEASSDAPGPGRRLLYGAMARVPRPKRPRWARAVYARE